MSDPPATKPPWETWVDMPSLDPTQYYEPPVVGTPPPTTSWEDPNRTDCILRLEHEIAQLRAEIRELRAQLLELKEETGG